MSKGEEIKVGDEVLIEQAWEDENGHKVGPNGIIHDEQCSECLRTTKSVSERFRQKFKGSAHHQTLLDAESFLLSELSSLIDKAEIEVKEKATISEIAISNIEVKPVKMLKLDDVLQILSNLRKEIK